MNHELGVMDKTIVLKNSGEEGNILAVFCGVHGNEKAGVFAVEKILKNVEIESGAVYFVFANPEAIKQNKRFIDRNLNRCFFNGQDGTSYEENRAVELMEILDKSDALLDIHASNSVKTTPFAITDNGLDIVKNMNFEIIATGFDNLEPYSADGYMKHKNKIGICLECGYSGESESNVDLAYNSIIQFLQYFDCIHNKIPALKIDQKILHVDETQKVTNTNFSLINAYDDFTEIKKGTIIAKDENNKYSCDRDRIILFASKGKPVGSEAYILGNWVK
jgi:succinylglutamate desuccinylase